jgi:hypothetical protein
MLSLSIIITTVQLRGGDDGAILGRSTTRGRGGPRRRRAYSHVTVPSPPVSIVSGPVSFMARAVHEIVRLINHLLIGNSRRRRWCCSAAESAAWTDERACIAIRTRPTGNRRMHACAGSDRTVGLLSLGIGAAECVVHRNEQKYGVREWEKEGQIMGRRERETAGGVTGSERRSGSRYGRKRSMNSVCHITRCLLLNVDRSVNRPFGGCHPSDRPTTTVALSDVVERRLQETANGASTQPHARANDDGVYRCRSVGL